MKFNKGESNKEIPYLELGLSNKRIYGLFSTANSAEGNVMPELQLYSTTTGLKGALHIGNNLYTAQSGCGFYVLIFHE